MENYNIIRLIRTNTIKKIIGFAVIYASAAISESNKTGNNVT